MWKYRSELVSISSVLSGIPVSMLQLTYSFIPSIQNKHQQSWLMPVLPLQYLTAIWDSNPSICGTAPVHSLPLAEASSATTSEWLLAQHSHNEVARVIGTICSHGSFPSEPKVLISADAPGLWPGLSTVQEQRFHFEAPAGSPWGRARCRPPCSTSTHQR